MAKSKIKRFVVTWQVEICDKNPVEAAREAQDTMRKGDWFFVVKQKGRHKMFGVDLANANPVAKALKSGEFLR